MQPFHMDQTQLTEMFQRVQGGLGYRYDVPVNSRYESAMVIETNVDEVSFHVHNGFSTAIGETKTAMEMIYLLTAWVNSKSDENNQITILLAPKGN